MLVGPNCFYLDDTLSKLNLKLNEKPPPNLEHTRTTRVTHKRRHRRVVVVVVVTIFITHYHLITKQKPCACTLVKDISSSITKNQ